MYRRFRLVVVLTALGLASCGNAIPQSQTTSPAISPFASHVIENDPFPPFAKFLYGPSDKIGDAVLVSRQATETCMRAAGWDNYVGFDSMIGAPPRDRDAFERKYFYGVTTRLDFSIPGEDQTPNPNTAFEAALSTTEQDEYIDDLWARATSADAPKLGCMYVGVQAGFGDLRAVAPKATEIQSQLDDEVSADPEYLAAQKAWSACMATGGHTYTDDGGAIAEVSAAVQDLAAQLGRPPKDADARKAGLQDLEEQLFWADMDCRSSTGHGKAITAVRQRIEGAYLDAHPHLTEELLSDLASPTPTP
jgi:hypothetical protein